MMAEAFSIVPGKSDKETADDLKKRAEEAMRSVCALMDEANESGLTLSFNLGVDYKGHNVLTNLTVFKKL